MPTFAPSLLSLRACPRTSPPVALGLLVLLGVSGLTAVLAPTALSAQASTDCDCPALFDALVQKVEATYPGYWLEVRGRPAEAAYREAQAALRQRAVDTTPGLECLRLLQDYVAVFADGHLFVGGRPPIRTAADSTRLRTEAPRVGWTEAEVQAWLDAHDGDLDPLEGIWIDPTGMLLAIVREGMDGGTRPGTRFTAFVVRSLSQAWATGDVRAELVALADGSYDPVVWDEARGRIHPAVHTRGVQGGARLQRDGLLLHLPPLTWGKLDPVTPGLEGQMDPLDPRAPTARLLGEGAVVFHVPSHVPSHSARLQALVEQYRGALERAELLVIDLRGNEGGSAFVTDVFLPFLMGPELRPARYTSDGAAAVLASEDNARYFERVGWAPSGLVARIQAAEPGTLVPFADPGGEDDPPPATGPATANPRHVAVLTDRTTVSAAEAFVLKAMRYPKVTLFGEATGGAIDYQTVNVVRFGCADAGLYVGYPTIVGSDRLPEGGVRATGIAPDVVLDPNAPDVFEQIRAWYAERGR